jgi:hypothetical protein
MSNVKSSSGQEENIKFWGKIARGFTEGNSEIETF